MRRAPSSLANVVPARTNRALRSSVSISRAMSVAVHSHCLGSGPDFAVSNTVSRRLLTTIVATPRGSNSVIC